MDKETSDVIIKSNITLRNRELVPPMDNMPKQYFDVRLGDALTPEQRLLEEKMMFWAKVVKDEKNIVEDKCYKGCENCGHENNNCKRPQNIKLQEIRKKNTK